MLLYWYACITISTDCYTMYYITSNSLISTFQYKLDYMNCCESRLKGLSQETTLVLSNTRELDRVPNTK